MNKVIITGASSMIGLSLIKEISDKVEKIYAVVRKSTDKLEVLKNTVMLRLLSATLMNTIVCPSLYRKNATSYIILHGAVQEEERNATALP